MCALCEEEKNETKQKWQLQESKVLLPGSPDLYKNELI